MQENVKPPVLMELTKDSLESGLRGVPVGFCTTSAVEADKGLFYVGEPVEKIADRDPEDVIHLLLYKHWPDASEKAKFAQLLRDHSQVDPGVMASLKALPRAGHPMKWFLHAINALGMVYTCRDYRREAIDLIAKIPVVTAALFRIREGWGEPIAPRADLGYMENFVHMLGIPGQSAEQKQKLVKLMRVFEITHLDHGGGNLSTFIGKAVASGKADLYESITGAMAGLRGTISKVHSQHRLTVVVNFMQQGASILVDEADVELL